MRPLWNVLCGFFCVFLFFGVPASAATAYTTSTDFFNAIRSDYYLEPFDSLSTTGPIDSPLNFSSGGYSYTASVTSGGFTGVNLGSGDVALSTNMALYAIHFAFSSGNVTAVGGNFWLTDISGGTTTGSTVLTLSDGTTTTLVNADPSTYAGFTTTPGVYITSLTLSVTGAPSDAWVTVNNLTVGEAVPEPSTFVLGAGGLLAFAVARRVRYRRRPTAA